MTKQPKPEQSTAIALPNAVTEASVRYSESTLLRSLITAIPFVGGSIDVLLSGHGAKFQQQRLESFLIELECEMQKVAPQNWLGSLDESEELFDLFVLALESVTRSRSTQKRRHFATLLRLASTYRTWDEADQAAKLLADLSDLHIRILAFAAGASPVGGVWKGLRVFSLENQLRRQQDEPLHLPNAMPEIPPPLLHQACADLVGRGLLRDAGVGRFDVTAMQFFRVTDFAEWFLRWIRAETP
jgi:uncharacterized protein YjiS (DUF1127 family)